jgi:hypothetical protein
MLLVYVFSFLFFSFLSGGLLELLILEPLDFPDARGEENFSLVRGGFELE